MVKENCSMAAAPLDMQQGILVAIEHLRKGALLVFAKNCSPFKGRRKEDAGLSNWHIIIQPTTREIAFKNLVSV